MQKLLATPALVFVLLASRLAADPVFPNDQSKVIAELAEAMRAKDLPKTLGLFQPNAVILLPNEQLQGGRKETEILLKRLFEYKTVEVTVVSLGATGSGSLGYDTGTFEATLTPNDGPPVKTSGKYLILLRQPTPNGKWLVAALMWNPNTPPPIPAATK